MEMKKMLGWDVFLSYPNFSKVFIIHVYAGKTHLWGVISQNGKPITFYKRKYTTSQIDYTATERELLSKAEAPK